MSRALEIGFMLDRQWHLLRGEDMDQTKKPSLLKLGRILTAEKTPYAIIGGIAQQVHREEPRTTVDIDLVVSDRSVIPRAALEADGFKLKGVHEHSENWLSHDGTPVQFTDDPVLREAIGRAEPHTLEDVTLRIINAADFVHAKLRAAADPARRRSKRMQDLTDVQAVLEAHPEVESQLTADERSLLTSGIRL